MMLDNNFQFDHTMDESKSTKILYQHTVNDTKFNSLYC